jgi:hypothetical protein
MRSALNIISWLSAIVFVITLALVGLRLETSRLQPDAEHPASVKSRSGVRYVSVEAKRLYDVGFPLLLVTGVIAMGSAYAVSRMGPTKKCSTLISSSPRGA